MNSKYSITFSNIAVFFFILTFSLLGGVWSVDYTLNFFHNFGRFTIGEWFAYPNVGTINADPYTRARTAKQGNISMGNTEGLVFQIWKDNHGRLLHPNCHYLLKGYIPEARFFTLYTADRFLKPNTSSQDIPFELYTDTLIYESDGSLRVNIAQTPQIGNWLATVGQKEFGLILTLYDTPIISTTALHKLTMPSVEKISSGQKNCD
ncbi:DUF1214 domain-containing protein [Bartonella raoultii]|uniref:DUF1214 domain-containing protein n=1 Tax=Bartonella raoultii TaxID=1457020 RepID=A0ABS7I5G6_9HYPH|nr:DUF1214 domain-containing protein [Bartonella raoultii]MBX4336106.1 DUF1214 domain-containing protein [Bartonella raoultii]